MSLDFEGLTREVKVLLHAGKKAQIVGANDALVELLLLRLLDVEQRKQFIVILASNKDLLKWKAFLDFCISQTNLNSAEVGIFLLPHINPFGNERFINHVQQKSQRLAALQALIRNRGKTLILTTISALAQRSLTPQDLLGQSVGLKKGQDLDIDEFVQKIEEIGYIMTHQVESPGSFSLRGSIVDIFPMNTHLPYRIETLFDKLASLRSFNIADQRSIDQLEEIFIGPCGELISPNIPKPIKIQKMFSLFLEQNIPTKDREIYVEQYKKGVWFPGSEMFIGMLCERTSPTLDYFAKDALWFYPNGIDSCIADYDQYLARLLEGQASDQQKLRPVVPIYDFVVEIQEISGCLTKQNSIIEFGNALSGTHSELVTLQMPDIQALNFEGQKNLPLDYDEWIKAIKLHLAQGTTIIILTQHPDQLDRLTGLLRNRKIPVTLIAERYSLSKVINLPAIYAKSGSLFVIVGYLSQILFLAVENILFVPDFVMYGHRQKLAKSSSEKLRSYLTSFTDLNTNDLVVHATHGIGRYLGLTRLTIDQIAGDFVVIEYAGGDKIYLPMDRLSIISRYASAGEHQETSPAVDRLGGNFEKRKAKVKAAVVELASQLLKQQAIRATAKGIKLGVPDSTYLKFEGDFPYEETPDQLRALEEIESDLSSGRPMDRLVCGDVGFGKTEVALRAAMRVILEGYQVLVLVPTTILCYQHFVTFSRRLETYGVNVAQANRFVGQKSINEALERFSSGSLDVLIGTHRILSKDVTAKKLGLLIVDEEQRFGVLHKERIKYIQADAHILTLSATPIPRTLHMSMVGLRDISIIATPPENRIPVKTVVTEFDEFLLKDAIQNEVRRGGQVFLVHNRVEDIEEFSLRIRRLIPGITIKFAHGQMAEHQLERVIADFIEHRFEVLICTTIIESGVDMPNVNTLIIDHAEMFGLSQLYQLRGRVGRSHLQAYAYLFVSHRQKLTNEAKKRLEVIVSHQELGSGFHIASQDLEIRGAGNLLGDSQSGHAYEVGLQAYTELLGQSIQELRGQPVTERFDTELSLPISFVIPDAYITSERQRLKLYKDIFDSDTEEDLRRWEIDLQDRFGPLPEQVKILFKIAQLKILLKRMRVAKLSAGNKVFELKFAKLNTDQSSHLLKMVNESPHVYAPAPNNKMIVSCDISPGRSLASQGALVTKLIELVEPLATF